MTTGATTSVRRQGARSRKHVQRASDDLRTVITTYDGQHSDDVPTVRGSAALYHPAAPPTDSGQLPVKTLPWPAPRGRPLRDMYDWVY